MARPLSYMSDLWLRAAVWHEGSFCLRYHAAFLIVRCQRFSNTLIYIYQVTRCHIQQSCLHILREEPYKSVRSSDADRIKQASKRIYIHTGLQVGLFKSCSREYLRTVLCVSQPAQNSYTSLERWWRIRQIGTAQQHVLPSRFSNPPPSWAPMKLQPISDSCIIGSHTAAHPILS
jgi:hypothetical protein